MGDINIKIHGLTDKMSLEVVESLLVIMDSFSFLDFRRFKNIIITSNFERDIEAITSKKSDSFKNRYRANKDTYASVLTIPKDKNNKKKHIIKHKKKQKTHKQKVK